MFVSSERQSQPTVPTNTVLGIGSVIRHYKDGVLSVPSYDVDIDQPQVDIVRCPDAALDEAWGERLEATFADGTPSTWEQHAEDCRRIQRGTIDGKQFIVKTRDHPRRYFEDPRQMKPPDVKWKKLGDPKRVTYAFSSILNELRLAPDVHKVVASRDCQAIARAAGFKSIAYIEPLLGVIDRRVGENGLYCSKKSIVYEYMPDLRTPSYTGFRRRKVAALAYDIGAVLGREGIDPIDLFPRQIKVQGRTKKLYLFDSEVYIRTEKSGISSNI